MMRRLFAGIVLLGISLGIVGAALAAPVTLASPDTAFDGGEAMLEVVFLKVPGGDCIFLRQGDDTMLIDGGLRKTSTAAIHLFQRLGVEKLTYALCTHPHDDHVEGFYNVLPAFPPERFYTMFPAGYKCDEQLQLMVMVDNLGVPVTELASGDVLSLGDARITVYQYPGGETRNSRSAVLLVTFGDARMLLTADIGGAQQFDLLENHPDMVTADILKMPHHGINACQPAFLDAVMPQAAVFTNVAKEIPIAVRQAENRGYLCFTTRDHGDVYAVTDGTRWTMEQPLSTK